MGRHEPDRFGAVTALDGTGELALRVADLIRRVERLEAERAILDVLHRYGPAIDDGDSAAWAGLFTVDGVWEVEGAASRIHLQLEGRDELRSFAEHHTRAPDAFHKHCVVDPVIDIDVDGGRATSTSYLLRLDGFDDGPTVQSFGRYADVLTRDEDGAWHFARRTVLVESVRPSPFGYRPDRAPSA